MRNITKTILQFLIGFLLVLVVSAFLAPWLYTFLPFKFDRILRRLIMIGTIVLAVGLIRISREGLGRLGLSWREGSFRLLGTGFLSGILLVVAISGLQLAFETRMWRLHETGVWHWIGLFFKGFGAGVLIGAIEEFFFRGFLFLTLKDLWNTKVSLVATNLIYALVHFFPKDKPLVGTEATVGDSFRLLTAMALAPWTPPARLLAVLGLFLFGLILSFLFLRFGSLYPSIGVHAGCVFALKLNRRFTPEITEKMGILSGSKNLYDGIVGLGVLTAACLLLGAGLKSAKPSPRKKGLLLALVLFLFSLSPPLGAQQETASSRFVYSFLEDLPRAEALCEKNGRTVEGRWMSDRFQFEGLPGADIFVAKEIPVNNVVRPAIWFQPLRGSELTLIFSGVLAGKQLRLFYALPDSVFQAGGVVPFQFECRIGKKKLFEVRSIAKGWNERKIDLTLPFLLWRRYRFTFRARSGDLQATGLVFYGYVE